MSNVTIFLKIMLLSVPKQHSIWAPVGPQLGQGGPQLGPSRAQLGPSWECCLGKANGVLSNLRNACVTVSILGVEGHNLRLQQRGRASVCNRLPGLFFTNSNNTSCIVI